MVTTRTTSWQTATHKSSIEVKRYTTASQQQLDPRGERRPSWRLASKALARGPS